VTRIQKLARRARLSENADVYLTAVVAVVLVLLDLTNLVPGQQIASVTLAVLALMSVNMLMARIKLGNFMDEHSDQQVPVTLDGFPPSYEHDWHGGGNLLLYGTSLLETILRYQQWIAERLSAGCTVRVLLMTPGSEAVVLASERCYLRTNHHDDAALQNVLALLRRFREETGGDLDIRFTKQEPTFTATCFRPGTPQAVIYVMYYRYRMNSDDQLRLVLRPRDGRWFNLHYDQLEHLWRDSASLNHQSTATASDADERPPLKVAPQ
jgi:hypothetical protein